MTTRPPIRHPYLDHPGVLAFAHRGGAAQGLENALVTFEKAVALGYRYLETDVHATSDGVLVAFHDDTLDRVTDGRGMISQLLWREVRKALIGGVEPIPRLEELLGSFPGARLNIDAKSPQSVGPLLDAIRRTNAWDRVCVASFSERRLRTLRAAAGPRLATSLGTQGVLGLRLRSLSGPLPADRLVGAAVHRGAVAVQVPVRSSGVRVVDAAFVRAAHRLGLQVHVWTINDAGAMNRLLDLGVDGIMTDRIETLREVLAERGDWVG